MAEKNTLYRFSPITDKQTILDAVEYVAKEATRMLFREQGYVLPIEYVTIFAHYDAEYRELVRLASELGSQAETNNGIKTKLKHPIEIDGMKIEVNGEIRHINHSLKYVRIRKPDPYRMQVGCCDFKYDKSFDYIGLASTDTVANSNIRRIQRADIDMIEFSNPDFDVLGYVVKK